MASRFFAVGALTALAAMTASSAAFSLRPNPLRPNVTPGTAPLIVVGSRSSQQRLDATDAKLDAVLADLKRHAGLARPGHVVADLHSLSPAARFLQTSVNGTPLVLVDAITRGNPQQMKSALVALGLQRPAVYSNDVGGWLPVNQIAAAAARGEVVSLRAAMPRTRATGPVATQGDYAQNSIVVRTDYPALTGAGVTVGVLSDSFNCYAVYAANPLTVPVSGYEGYAFNGFTADYATDVSTGALLSGVDVLAEAYTPTPSPTGDCLAYGAPTQTPFGDEGRAMMQIIYAVAPGASLAFYTAEDSEAYFATGIGALATAGAKVIADDVGYFDEPFFQDGIVAQAIDTVEAQGVAYFSAAGNDASMSYENLAPSFATLSSSTPNSGEYLLNFDTTGATTTTALPVTVPPIPPGDFVAIVVEWDQPYVTGCTATPASLCTGATSSVDVCITGGTGSDTITDYDGNATSCTGPNAAGVDPVQIMIIGNPANAAGPSHQQTFNIMVGLAANANGTPAPGRVIVAVEDDGLGSTINSFATNSATLQGHPGAAGAAAVGAAFYFDTPRCGTTPAELEPFSSQGGAPILFTTAGVRLATPVVRQKPDFVGPDGTNDTFLGFTLASDSPPYPSTGLLNTSITECQNNPSYPNFFGTSAATPHAAGIAVLMLQANAAVTPAQIYSSLRNSALAMPLPLSGPTTPNFYSGYGFIQADAALVVPTLTLGATSVPINTSTTLTWSSVYATSCTASGSANAASSGWTIGVLPATSGSVTLTPPTAGIYTYTVICSNAFTTSTAVTVTLGTGPAPAAPTLSLAAKSVVVGKSTTLTWSSVGTTGCTASGSWTGSLAASGNKTITPTAIGSEIFTLTCIGTDGVPSAATSVTLTATSALVAPAAPTLKLAATSIPSSSTTSITWSSVNATSCAASGSANAVSSGWMSGTLSATGSDTLTPVTTGTYTFTLTCSNAAGTSPATSVTLTVTAAPVIGSGGGALDSLTLLGLAGLGLARLLRAGRRSALVGT